MIRIERAQLKRKTELRSMRETKDEGIDQQFVRIWL